MEKIDAVIVGGGPAGVVTAMTVRRHNPKKSVMLIRIGEKSLIPCGIPYVFGQLETVEKNIMADKGLVDNNIQLIIDEVISIDKEKQVLSTAKGLAVPYDKLVLATGSLATKPPIKGAELKGVFVIKKNMDYVKEMKKAADAASSIVIVGGGFIGVELADELVKKGKKVTIVEMLPHILQQSFDSEFYTQVEKGLKESGVNIIVETKVTEINGGSSVESITLSDGKKVDADMVVLCIGFKPNSDLAKRTGLEIGSKGGVVVDEYMRTSQRNIFALGDCAEERDFFTRECSTVMLASTATSEARIAGANLFGLRVIKQNKGTIGIFSTCICGQVLAATGLTETKAQERGFEYVTGTFKAPDRHPASISDCTEMNLKLLFSKDSGVILGGQVSGGKSVGEVINIIGLAIQTGMTIAELNTLQIGTHPLLTPAPTMYPLILAAENALNKEAFR